jgi:hypothetical protein
MLILEEKLRKEPYGIIRLEKSTAEKTGENYNMFLDVEIATPEFKDLIYLIITYGPTSVEILEPAKIELNLSDAQEVLNSIVSAVHYYVSYILQLEMKELKKAQKGA